MKERRRRERRKRRGRKCDHMCGTHTTNVTQGLVYATSITVLTLANDTSVFIVGAVIVTPGIGWTLREVVFSSLTLDLIQPDGD